MRVVHTLKGENGAPDIVTTEYYDVMGNVAKTSVKTNGAEKVNTYAYDYLGNLTQEKTAYTTDRGGSYTNKYTYSALGNVLTATNADGYTSSYSYDLSGRQVSATDYKGSTATYSYDGVGRLLSESYPFDTVGGATVYSQTLYSYDQAGNVTSVRQTGNAPGQAASYSQTNYEYDDMSRLIQAEGFDNGSAVSYTQYYYDAAGNMLRQYTGMGSPLTISGLDQVSGAGGYAVTKYGYDTKGRLMSVTDALGQTESYVYDTDGSLVSKTDRNGSETVYTYNKTGNLISTVVTDASGAETGSALMTYYSSGALKSESGGGITTTYSYNDMGLIAGETQSDGVTRAYTYDAAGNRLSMTMSKNGVTKLSMTYVYDSMGRLYQVKENGSVIATYAYDQNGNRASLTYPNGVVTSYAYNAANLVTSLQNKKGSVTLSAYEYTYLLDGNQASKTDENGRVTTYSYDGLGRLTGESESTGLNLVYTYDSFGNRASLTSTGTQSYVTTYTYDLNNRLLEETKGEDGATYITDYYYDGNGNTLSSIPSVLTSGTGTAEAALSEDLEDAVLYEYDGFNRQIKVQTGEAVAEYTYLASGLRRSKTVDGVTTAHIWDGGNIIADEVNGTITNTYLRGVGLIATDLDGSRSYYLCNAHGDVTSLTNSSGTITQKYDYDAFGNLRDVDGYSNDTDTNPFRYCGEYFDGETSTIYLRARYYNPRLGRFMTEDPIRDGLNWYTYCGNSPLVFIDPWGEDAVLINKPVDNAANTIGIEHMSAFFQDENDNWWFFFWGDTVKYVQVDDASIFDNLDKMNQWLIDYRDPDDPDLRLLTADHTYRDSVYIKGDFTASHSGALELLDIYRESLKSWDGKGLANQKYNVATKNCGQVTLDLFSRGTLPSGMTVLGYMAWNGYGSAATIPNLNMNNMQKIFYNKSTNLAGFEDAIKTQKAKYEGKSDFIQWWHTNLRVNIDMIS